MRGCMKLSNQYMKNVSFIQRYDAPCPVTNGLVHRATSTLSRKADHEFKQNLGLIKSFARIKNVS